MIAVHGPTRVIVHDDQRRIGDLPGKYKPEHEHRNI
jgi:hypothetical protein